jgi:hypothetical protein
VVGFTAVQARFIKPASQVKVDVAAAHVDKIHYTGLNGKQVAMFDGLIRCLEGVSMHNY